MPLLVNILSANDTDGSSDKFGLSWQVIHTAGDFEQKLVPVLMYVGDVCGKAEEAMEHYASVFKDAPAREAGETNTQVLSRYGQARRAR